MTLIQATAKSIIIPALLGVSLLACAPNDQPTRKSGAVVFEENCSPCHGPQRRGPALAELHALAPDELRSAIRNHPTAGQIPQKLPANNILALIEYIEE